MESGDVGRCVIVLISDGRANVPLNISLADPTVAPATPAPQKKLTDAEKKEQRTALKDEVMSLARTIGSMSNIKLLVIDTENKVGYVI
jgi:magnesium chelatase subunit D